MLTRQCDICGKTENDLRYQGIGVDRFKRTSWGFYCEKTVREFDICDSCLERIAKEIKNENNI